MTNASCLIAIFHYFPIRRSENRKNAANPAFFELNCKLAKLRTWVRFLSPAPYLNMQYCSSCQFACAVVLAIFLISFRGLSWASVTDELQLTAIEPKAGVTTPASKVTVYGTGFSPDATVYIGGLQVRETKFLNPSVLEVLTPYLRPGVYKLQLKSAGRTLRTEVTFKAEPSQVDREIDRGISLARGRRPDAGIQVLTAIAKTNADYQVRAFAHYEIGQIYLGEGDLLRWGWTLTFLDADKSGMAVQTCWKYGLDNAESTYFLNGGTGSDYDLRNVDVVVDNDVTNAPEPRFFRSLLNARYGNLEKAKADNDIILKIEPDNPSYRALAAYIGVLSGEKIPPHTLGGTESETDATALSLLGQAAYLSGDETGAQLLWNQEAKAYPLGSSFAYWAGKKHLAHGQRRVAQALLAECATMAPRSKEGDEASRLLAESEKPGS
jgi:hypothetical protein